MLSNPFQSFLNGLNRQSGGQRRVNRAARRSTRIARGPHRSPRVAGCSAETLEDRLLLSGTPVASPTFILEGRVAAPGSAQPAVSTNTQPSFVAPISPTQMQAAYGVNLISFNGIKGTGQGQTIAIVDAYNDPNIQSDANTFSTAFGLPQFNAGGPTLQVLNETGGTSLTNVPNSTPGGWDVEESLDVEWAHSIAPQANIILFEGNSSSLFDLLTAEQTAADTTGVSTVSNSWASGEFSGEQSYDSYFETPTGHQGVTFLASTGDHGTPAGYPAYSPNVVAVGGTSLDLNSSGTYQAESGWSGSGGGISGYESQPSYQNGKVNGLSSTQRTAPDISIDADPNTGVYVLDTFYESGYLQVGGTSLACPMTAALVSIADQGRILNGLTTLDGRSQTLPDLYNLSTANFHDITTGNNGYAAGTGYDLVTGIGSPIANDVVMALAGSQSSQPPSVTAPLTATTGENNSYTFSGTISATDSAATGTSDSLSLSVVDGALALNSTTGLTFVSGANNSQSMTVSGTLTNLNAAVNGLVYTPTSGYSGSDFLQTSVEDADDDQTGWASVNFTVTPTAAPAITAPAAVNATENTIFAFNGSNTISVADSAGTTEQFTVSLVHGSYEMALGGLTLISNTQNTLEVSGTLSQLNTALSTLDYVPATGFVGTDTMSLSDTDTTTGQTGTATVTIAVSPLPPSFTTPGVVFLNGSSVAFNGGNAFSLLDPGGTSEQMTMSVLRGTLDFGTATGLTFGNGTTNNSSSITVSGTLANIDSDLSSLTYTQLPADAGTTDRIDLSDTDTSDGKSGSAVLVILNQAPTVAAPATAAVGFDGSFQFSTAAANSISIADTANTASSDWLFLKVSHGTLALASTNGITFQNGTTNNSSSITISGSLLNMNTALNGLTYAPTTGYSGSDSLVAQVEDLGDGLNASASVAITVSTFPAPSISGPGTTYLNENSSWTFSGTVMAYDSAASGTSDSISFSVTDGTLALGSTTGLTFDSGTNNSSSMTVTGTLSSLNAALNGLSYFPNTGYSGTDSLQMTITDSGDSLSNSARLGLVISPPPTVSAPLTASLMENSSYTFSTISVADSAFAGFYDSVSVSVAQGTLTLGSTTGLTFDVGSNNSSSMTFSGTLANMNAALSGLVYTPNAAFSGSDSLAISIVDSADNLSASASVALTVTSLWTDMSNPVPNSDGVGVTLLLPNGDLLTHGGAGGDSTTWYLVTPDSTGNYVNGTWTQAASMNVGRLYFGSDVLPNGNVFVVGGEYATDGTYDGQQLLSNSAEIYNPAANKWTQVASSPLPYVGDESTEVLPDGNIMVGDIFDNGTEIYDPTTNTWSAGATKVYDDRSDEEGWVKLPNGDILTYDIFASIAANKFLAEIYNPTTNTWSDASTSANGQPLPLLSTAATGYESGLGIMLPDGQAMWVGTNGNVVFYNYQTNSWTIGPSLPVVNIDGTPTQLTVGDAPGAVLPNGNVLMSLSPAVDDDNYPGPTYIYEFNPTTGVYTNATPTTSQFDTSYNSFVDGMLVLPTGQVFVTNFEGDPAIYTPNGSPNSAWRPTISSVTENQNGSLTLTGTQLNGLDEGAEYGDDNQMAENYPIVRVTDSTTGTVYYATTSNWSSVNVATGSTPETVNVVLPAGLGSDPFTLVVIADGIASSSISSSSIPPIVTAPASINLNENTSYTFPEGAVSVGDVAATATSDSLTLSVSDGKLTFISTTGLNFSSGANGTSSMTVTGTLANLDAAVGGLIYTPNTGYSGSDALQIALKDNNDNLSGSATVAITVNAPPSISAPSSASVIVSTPYSFAGTIHITDAAASGFSDSLTISVSDGTLDLQTTTGLTFTGTNNSSSMTVTGTLASLNAAIGSLVYSPTTGWTGLDSLHISVVDSGDSLSGTASVAISVNSPPGITAPSTAFVWENTALNFSAGMIGINDTAASGASDSLSLSVSDGILLLGSTTGLTFTSGANGTSSMSVTGTLANLNAALSGLGYEPTTYYSGSDTLQLSVKDANDNLSGSASVAITVAPSPVLYLPGSVVTGVNTPFTFAGTISLVDLGASGQSDTLTLTVSDGIVNLGTTTGVNFVSGANGTSSMTIGGTMAVLNAAVNGLVYSPATGYSGSDTLHIVLEDVPENRVAAGQVAITVSSSPPPSIVAPSSVNVNENGTFTFSGGSVSIKDQAASGASDSFTLAIAHGKLALATTGLTFTSGANNSSSMAITGTLANLNAALNGLVYTPTAGFSGHDSLQLSVKDAIDGLSASATVAISVNPYVTAPASVSLIENTSFPFTAPSYPITLTDGAASGTSDSLSLSVLHGKVTLSTLSGLTITAGANGTSAVTVSGTLANLNAALNGLVYTPTANFTGQDTLTITVSDSVDGLSGSSQVAITVTPRKIVVGVALSSNMQTTPFDDATTDDSTQWAGLSAALPLLDE